MDGGTRTVFSCGSIKDYGCSRSAIFRLHKVFSHLADDLDGSKSAKEIGAAFRRPGALDTRNNQAHSCADLNSFMDCSSEKIPQGVEKRQHISLTERDVSGVVFDGPGLCWRARRLRAYLMDTNPAR